jgi:hypothetical protein
MSYDPKRLDMSNVPLPPKLTPEEVNRDISYKLPPRSKRRYDERGQLLYTPRKPRK